MRTDLAAVEAEYLPAIRALPFVDDARLLGLGPGSPSWRPDARLRVRTATGVHDLWVELKTSHLARATVTGVLAMARESPEPLVLFAPLVTRPVAEQLASAGVNFVDRAGNIRLALGSESFAMIVGRRPPPPRHSSGGRRLAGILTTFAFLARPEWLDAPVRSTADAIGVSKNAVADTRRRLIAEGSAVVTTKGTRFVEPRHVRDRWLAAFAEAGLPKLTLGRFRTADKTPRELEARVADVLGRAQQRWAWGGGAAAARLVEHFRGATTSVWIEELPSDLPVLLRAIPDREGPLVILRAPGPLVFEGRGSATVHPLLVWAELLATHDDRAAEAAAHLAERFPEVFA